MELAKLKGTFFLYKAPPPNKAQVVFVELLHLRLVMVSDSLILFTGENIKNIISRLFKTQHRTISLKWFGSAALILNLAGLHVSWFFSHLRWTQ